MSRVQKNAATGYKKKQRVQNSMFGVYDTYNVEGDVDTVCPEISRNTRSVFLKQNTSDVTEIMVLGHT